MTLVHNFRLEEILSIFDGRLGNLYFDIPIILWNNGRGS